jgi:hypothetical protein
MKGTYLSTDKGKTWDKNKKKVYCYTIAVNRNDEIFTITAIRWIKLFSNQ